MSRRPKQRNQKQGQCVYCGESGPITDDHVPPRAFYPSTAPKNLITVPCCEVCNKAFAKDDDYVRLVFATGEGAMGNPDRDQLLPKLKRFAERPESKRILKSLYDSLRAGYVLEPSGLYMRRNQFVADGERLDTFARRTAKALFFREKQHRLEDGWIVNAIHHRRFATFLDTVQEHSDFLYFVIEELNNQTAQSWRTVFAYTWWQSPKQANATWWLLHFYGNPLYLCWTAPSIAAETGAVD